jgi:8-oxo-dGTP diphosphatase
MKQGDPFSLSVKVVIRDSKDRCLLLKRSMASKGNPGKWEFPGGKLEEGEDFDFGLLREVEEETGLRITLERAVGTSQSESSNRRIVYLIMEGRSESTDVRLSEEHDDYVWVPPGELARMDLSEQFIRFARAYGQNS